MCSSSAGGREKRPTAKNQRTRSSGVEANERRLLVETNEYGATRDMVHLPLVIDILKRTCCVLHSSEILEESPQPGERWQIVSDLHLSIVVLTRCFTSDDVKSRLPKGL